MVNAPLEWAFFVANVRTRTSTVQLQTRDLHLNYESGQENVGLRTNAVAGAYDINDIANYFTHNAHIENRTFSAPALSLTTGVWADGFPQSAAPLTLRIPALPNGERAFEFYFECPDTPGTWIQSYDFTTGVLGGLNEGYCYNIRHIFDSLPIRPKTDLPAGVHQTDVRIYQRGWVWSGTQPTAGSPPNYAPELRDVWLGAVPIPGSNHTLLNPDNGQFRVTFEVLGHDLDVGISKTNNATEPLRTGDSVTYTITVTNNGEGVANDVVVTDALPDGLRIVSAWIAPPIPTGANLNFNFINRIVTATIPALGVGETVEIVIVATVTKEVAGSIINTAYLTVDGEEGGNSSSEINVLPPLGSLEPDVEIYKTASANTVQVGQTFQYTITVGNTGEGAALGVVVTDELPDGVSFVSSTSTRPGVNFTHDNGILRANVGTLAPGEEITFTVTVRADAEGEAINEAVVSGDNFEDEEDDVEVTITPGDPTPQPVVEITKTAANNDTPFYVGDTITYTITVTNAGTVPAHNIVVTDTLPSGVQFVSSTSSVVGINFTRAGQVLTANVGTLEAGEYIELTVVTTAYAAGTHTNSAGVTGNFTPPPNVEVDVIIITPIEPEPGIRIQKDGPGTAVAGTEITYTITVENTGNTVLRDVVVTDELPETLRNPGNVVLNPLTAGSGRFTGQTLEVNIPELRIGQVIIITFTATLCDTLLTGAMVVNTAIVTTGCGEEEEDDTTTTVNNTPGLEMIKRAQGNVLAGADLPYTITVENTGNVILRNVVVTDQLPETLLNPRNLVIDPATAGTGRIIGRTIEVVIPELRVGELVTISFVTTVSDALRSGETIVNNATVTTECGKEEEDNVTTTVNNDPGIEIIKRAPSRVVPRGDIPYTLTVINTGNTILRDVVVTDSLPVTLTNPRNLVINPVSAGTGSFTGRNLRVDIPELGIGETVVITFTATVAENVAVGTNIRNDANVSTGCGLEDDDTTTTLVERPPGPPKPPEPPKPPGAPLTGDSVRMLLYIVLAQFAAGASLVISYMRRRRKDK